jgi:hypothetical protein
MVQLRVVDSFVAAAKSILGLALFVMCGASVVAQDQWKIFANLAEGRHHHRAKYLNDGKILVIGGYVRSRGILDGTPTQTTELIDVNTGAVTSGPSMTFPRAEFPMVELPNGDIVVLGGYSLSSSQSSVERYSVANNAWTVIGSMQDSRRQHAAVLLNDHEILVFGGFQNSSAEIFSLRTGQSRPVAPLPGQANSAVVISPGNRQPSFWGFRQGGPNSGRSTTSIRYDVPTDRWLADLVFDESPVAPRVVRMGNGSVTVISGAVSESPFVTTTRSWVVTPAGAIQRGATLLQGRQWHVAGLWGDDRILVASGLGDNARVLSTCEWLNASSGTTDQAPTLNVGRSFSDMVIVRSPLGRHRAFVISGLTASNGNTQTVEVLEDSCFNSDLRIPLSDMRLVGDAVYAAPNIMLTRSATYQRGAAWLPKKINVSRGLDVRFMFRLNNGNDNGQVDKGPQGADGVVFVLQNSLPTTIGRVGDGIGYNETPSGLAVEFDAFLNAAFSDPSGSHIAIQAGDGQYLRSWHVPPYLKAIATKDVPQFVADGRVFHARIVLEGTTMSVYCDTTGDLRTPVVVATDIDLSKILTLGPDGATYAGFTAATGFAQQSHEILGLQIGGCETLVSVDDETEWNTDALSAYVNPNPASGSAVVNVSYPSTRDRVCRVLDTRGSVVLQIELPSGQTRIELPLDRVTQGMYAVQIQDGSQVVSIPMVVVR